MKALLARGWLGLLALALLVGLVLAIINKPVDMLIALGAVLVIPLTTWAIITEIKRRDL